MNFNQFYQLIAKFIIKQLFYNRKYINKHLLLGNTFFAHYAEKSLVLQHRNNAKKDIINSKPLLKYRHAFYY